MGGGQMGAGAAPTVMGRAAGLGGIFINKHQVIISQGRLCGGSLSAPFAAALGTLCSQRGRSRGGGRHALFSS